MINKIHILILLALLSGITFAKAQCLNGDCENGFGELKTENESFSGFFKDGKYNGSGILQNAEGVHWGAFKNGLKHGFGVLSKEDRYQTGHWVNGKIFDYILEVYKNISIKLASYTPDGRFKDYTIFPSMPLNADGSGCKFGDCKDGWSQRIFTDKGYSITSKMNNYQFSEIMILQEDNGNMGFLSYRLDENGHRMAVILNTKNWYIGMFDNNSAKDGLGAEYEFGQLKQAGLFEKNSIKEVYHKQ